MIDIRQIELRDVDIVFSQVYKLASQSGGVPPDFVLTRERLINELFAEQADWHGLVATKNNKIIGSCLYEFVNTNRPFNNTACLFIDIFFIEPDSRQKGVGELLMGKLINIAHNRGLSRIEFCCLKDNDVAKKFYMKIGAKKLELLDVYNLNI